MKHIFTPFIFLFLFLFMLLAPGQILAETNGEMLFDEASTAYSKADYQRAVELYEELVQTRGYSPSLLYNLAGSYLGTNTPGKAILNYERAAMLAPGDSDIKGNLATVRNEQGLFDHEKTVVEKLTYLLGMNQWLWLGLVAFGLVVMLLMAGLKTPLTRMHGSLAALGCMIIAVSVFATSVHYRHWQTLIVTAPDSRLVISPFEGASSVGEIKEGSRVFEIERHGNFIRVQDNGGRKGWLPVTTVEPVVPQ